MNEPKHYYYYFTFASTHPLGDKWIEIHAATWIAARYRMMELYGTKWSMQYNEATWDPEATYFPGGRHGYVIEVI